MKTFVLFDIDGTLLYSNKVDSQSFATSYERIFGREFPTIDWTRFPSVTDHVIFRTAFHDHFGRYPSEEERQVFEDDYVANLQRQRVSAPEDFREVPGAAALWRRLAEEDDLVTGIATGGWKTPASIKLAHVGIPENPPYAGYANGHFRRETILQTAIDRASAEHDVQRVVYIGDAIWDVSTTRAMKIPLIGIRRQGDHHVLHQAGADTVITDFQNQDSFLEILRKKASESGQIHPT
ncbi:HAD family hydrolase [Lewinella sp. W8]|uniref:HAD family hydrolase n=1 Tax=Lewinella sp. W8 TaxID=2528208 RepID=UPI001067A29B|nr:HAD family hydrolase [Lewinella sp. W8]MTB51003.1 HAD hydrolase-like protein [Lewinella sp. W8]